MARNRGRSGRARDNRHYFDDPVGIGMNKCRTCGAYNPHCPDKEAPPEHCTSCGASLASHFKVDKKTFEPTNKDGERVRRVSSLPAHLRTTATCGRCGRTWSPPRGPLPKICPDCA